MDFIQRLFKLSDDERKEQLFRAIRGKCRFPVSAARLDYIATRLNLQRVYFIKATSDPNKFLNIATSEHIETKDKILLSQVFPLYGKFTPGYFVKTDRTANTLVFGAIDNQQEAAAVKITLTRLSCGMVSTTYTLVLYELRRKL